MENLVNWQKSALNLLPVNNYPEKKSLNGSLSSSKKILLSVSLNA